MRIQPAEQQVAVLNGGGYRVWLSGIVKARHGFDIDWDNIAQDARPIHARISRGDWVCSCDLLAGTEFACGGSVVVSYNDPYMICDECVNSEWEHAVRLVTFPPEKDRLIIEELLTSRPHPALRNYVPSDTITDVKEANSAKYWLNK